MRLKIEIPADSGIEMEENINKCISDFAEALKNKGFCEMDLTAYDDSIGTPLIYKLTLK